jgi:isomerase DpgB
MVEQACRELERDPTGRVLVLWVTGPSIRDAATAHPVGTSVHEINKWEKTLRRVECLPVPVVCVLEGDCTGLGSEVALVGDVRIAAVGARIGLTPLEQGGIPGMAVVRLARQLGAGHARRFTLLGTSLAASDAIAIGLLDVVCEDPQGELDDSVRRLSLADASDWATWRRLITDESAKEFDDVLGVSLAACDRSLRRRTLGG